MDTLPHAEVQEHLVRDDLRRHFPLMLVLAILFGFAASQIASRQPHELTSEARVLINATTGNALSPDATTSSQRITVAMVTEAAIVDSPAVATSVARVLGVETGEVVMAMSASVPANTQLVSIKYTADTAEGAQRGAKLFADAYLAYRKSLSAAIVKSQLTSLNAQQKDVATKLAAAGSAAAVTDAKPDANALVQLYAGRLATIQNNIAAATSTATNPGSVVDPPDLPTVTATVVEKALVPAGALLGLALGFVIALWRERRDDRIRGAGDHNILGAPLLTVVPGRVGARLALVDGGNDLVSESYRHARAGLLAAKGVKGRVFGVAGATTGTTVGHVTLNLGSALSRAGHTTAVVDATAGTESLAALAEVSPDAGFSDALESDLELADLAVAVHGVDLVAAGHDPANSRDLFHSTEMQRAITSLSQTHSHTLLASAGIMTAEGSGVAIASDGVIVVVENRRTTHAELNTALQRCAELGSAVVGVIIVPAAKGRWWSSRTSDRVHVPEEPAAAPDSPATATVG